MIWGRNLNSFPKAQSPVTITRKRSVICYLPRPAPWRGAGVAYALAQESLSVTVRLSTGLPGTERRLSAQK